MTLSERDHQARRDLRALLFVGLFIALLETVGGGVLLYLYWTRLPNATVPAWRLWQTSFIYGALSLLILLGILIIGRRFLSRLSDATRQT